MEQKRIELEHDEIPFDRSGMHSTGFMVKTDDSGFWYEYEDEDGNLQYLR